MCMHVWVIPCKTAYPTPPKAASIIFFKATDLALFARTEPMVSCRGIVIISSTIALMSEYSPARYLAHTFNMLAFESTWTQSIRAYQSEPKLHCKAEQHLSDEVTLLHHRRRAPPRCCEDAE